MIINVYWEFDLRYNASVGELKDFGIESLKDYNDLCQKAKRKIYEKFADTKNVPLKVDLSDYWREPECAYKEDITDFLSSKWGFSVKSWSKEWYAEHI
jgi:hypothetical protein